MTRTATTRQHLLEVHLMPGLLYASLDPQQVHLEAHRLAARNVLEAKYGTDGMVTDANVEMVALASIDAEQVPA
jgi:hypothetical protein